VDVGEASRLIGSATFVDVRQAYEYEAGHVPSALNVPIGQIKARYVEFSSAEVVVVICQIGQRSSLVADFLRTLGRDAHNLEGGLEAWAAHGLPLEGSGPDGGRVVDGWARDLAGNRLEPDPDR
jgi:rhodanese-related sulfurtransferase